jgi:hypothetical protein
MFLYTRCPLRKGLDVLAPKKHANGVEMNFFEMLDEVIDGGRIPRFSVDLGANPAARVIPDRNDFELTISADISPNNAAGVNYALIDAINYALIDHREGVAPFPQDFTGFFVTLRQVINDEQGNARGYVFAFERDTLNTAIMQRRVLGINGGNVLIAKTDAQDVAQSGVLTGAAPIVAPVLQDASPAEAQPARNITGVRIAALFAESIGTSSAQTPVGVFWVVSDVIPYDGDSGTTDAAKKEAYKKLVYQYGYLSTCSRIYIRPHGETGGGHPRVDAVKIYIVPELFFPTPVEGVDGVTTGFASFALTGGSESGEGALPYNNFFVLRDGLPRHGQTALLPPTGWNSKDARKRFTKMSIGAPSKRVEIDAANIEAGARLYWGLCANQYYINIVAGEKVIDITEDFETPVLRDTARQIAAANATGVAVSGVASAVSIAAGVATANPMAIIGGALSAARLIGEQASLRGTPQSIEAEAKAFRTLYNARSYNGGTSGGIYWERYPTRNAQILGRYTAAFGEKFTYTPVLGISDVFTNGTREHNCLYFKIAGGVIDGDVSAEDGAEVLEAFQDGVRLWKDWRKMKLADYGS